MKGHPAQRDYAGYIVPFRSLTVRQSEQIHLVRPQIVAQKADTENNQVLPVQPLPSPAEYGPCVENQGQIHPDHCLYKHLRFLLHLNNISFLLKIDQFEHNTFQMEMKKTAEEVSPRLLSPLP
jgi:hypothetical protein